MASPKVFVSSTCFDLKEIRDSLRRFIQDFGFDPVLSDYGDVFYHPDLHTHDACIHEISNCQLFVLIIGGRFGGTYVNDKQKSITNAEYEAARQCNIPIFTYVKRGILENHHIYTINRSKDAISEIDFPAIEKKEHALDIFNFIDHVRRAKTNNAFEGFENSNDIEFHLRKQWAGMFFDFLKNREVRQQINVANIMLSSLQTSSEKMEELVKGLYISSTKNESKAFLEDIDVKYNAINYFKSLLGTDEDDCEAYLSNEEDINTLAEVDPANHNWHEYAVQLGCYRPGEFKEEDGSHTPTIEFCGLGKLRWHGFTLGKDEMRYHTAIISSYENGLKRLSKSQRIEIISKFAKSNNSHIKK